MTAPLAKFGVESCQTHVMWEEFNSYIVILFSLAANPKVKKKISLRRGKHATV